jgi:hypothetical protein
VRFRFALATHKSVSKARTAPLPSFTPYHCWCAIDHDNTFLSHFRKLFLLRKKIQDGLQEKSTGPHRGTYNSIFLILCMSVWSAFGVDAGWPKRRVCGVSTNRLSRRRSLEHMVLRKNYCVAGSDSAHGFSKEKKFSDLAGNETHERTEMYKFYSFGFFFKSFITKLENSEFA